jgi:hypothetical protein
VLYHVASKPPQHGGIHMATAPLYRVLILSSIIASAASTLMPMSAGAASSVGSIAPKCQRLIDEPYAAWSRTEAAWAPANCQAWVDDHARQVRHALYQCQQAHRSDTYETDAQDPCNRLKQEDENLVLKRTFFMNDPAAQPHVVEPGLLYDQAAERQAAVQANDRAILRKQAAAARRQTIIDSFADVPIQPARSPQP